MFTLNDVSNVYKTESYRHRLRISKAVLCEIILRLYLHVPLKWPLSLSLPPTMMLGQGNVFTGNWDYCRRGGVCLSACWDTTHPPTHPPGADPFLCEQTPPRPRGRPPPFRPPQRKACWEIRSTRGRYASYWNAILFKNGLIESSVVMFAHYVNKLKRSKAPLRKTVSLTVRVNKAYVTSKYFIH